MHESFVEAVEAHARAGFPRPQIIEEWGSWLTYEACMSIYRGVQTGDVVMFRKLRNWTFSL